MAHINNKTYKHKIKESINNEILQRSLDNFTKAYPIARKSVFDGLDEQQMINDVMQTKSTNISKLEDLYEQFKAQAEAKGIIVHYADDAESANNIIAKIAKENDVKKIIKSKSMTSEETHLNKYLEKQDFEIVETDLGEWIIQLRGEGPSHMVLPAIHLSKGQVAELFSEVTKEKQPEEVEQLVKVARQELRQRYLEADMGITGANFAIAESGTIGLVTNEGNARLTTTLPRVHVALIGLEKLVETVNEAMKIIDILPKNATAQNITSYITWITGKNENSTNTDKQSNYHIVFLDNGRKKLALDEKYSEILNCIRCGACANVCPVYGAVGGHSMGHVYIGPIGLLLTHFYHGKENAKSIIYNCINCHACSEVCASGIKLPELIQQVQLDIQKEDGRPFTAKMIGKLMKNRKLFHSFLKMGKFGQLPFKGSGEGQFLRHLPSILFLKDQKFKTLPALAPKSLRQQWDDIVPKVKNPKLKIAFFAGCLHDFAYPEQVLPMLKIFKENNIQAYFPQDQSCCGLPLSINGDIENTKDIAIQNVDAFAGDYDYIVTMCASCASFLKKSYPKLITDDSDLVKKTTQFSDKIIDFSSLIVDVIGIKPKPKQDKKVAYHAPCHLCRGLDVVDAPRDIIKKSGYEYVIAYNEEVCCGFGGTYSMKFPEISAHRMHKKLDGVVETNADILVTDCPGCIMQLKGGADKRGDNFEVKHIAEIID